MLRKLLTCNDISYRIYPILVSCLHCSIFLYRNISKALNSRGFCPGFIALVLLYVNLVAFSFFFNIFLKTDVKFNVFHDKFAKISLYWSWFTWSILYIQEISCLHKSLLTDWEMEDWWRETQFSSDATSWYGVVPEMASHQLVSFSSGNFI